MKTLAEKIEVMQAALDGKKIRYRIVDGLWSTPAGQSELTVFNWAEFDYEVKPEPIEFWINIYSREKDFRWAYQTEEEAANSAAYGYLKTIKVREVIE